MAILLWVHCKFEHLVAMRVNAHDVNTAVLRNLGLQFEASDEFSDHLKVHYGNQEVD